MTLRKTITQSLPTSAMALFVVLALAGCIDDHGKHDEQLLQNARQALSERRLSTARQLARQILLTDQEHADALMIAAIASAELGEFQDALDYCSHMTTAAGKNFVDARCMAGNLYLNQFHDVEAAEKAFRQALEADANNSVALNRLSYLLSLQTRTWELIPIQLRLIRSGTISPHIVLSLVQSDLLLPDAGFIEAIRDKKPDQPGLILAKSRLAMLRKDYESAARLAVEALRLDPSFVEGHARLGEILASKSPAVELSKWQESLPTAALEHPTVWIVLGKIAERNGDVQGAARCFWEAGQRDAASLAANYMLGRQLVALGEVDAAQPFLDRARLLEKYRKLFDQGGAAATQLTPRAVETAGKLAESLGLIWEAYAFARLAQSMQPVCRWAEDAIERLQSQLTSLPLQRIAPHADIFASLNLADYEIPGRVSAMEAPAHSPHFSSETVVRFENVAEALGIDFRYDNGVGRRIRGAQRPYDFTGGGIAVVDFDGDSWPDLYFAQGCNLHNGTREPLRGQPDQLFRNLDGRRFQNVSQNGLPPDIDYSQGVAAGDFNNDGFADIYVANLGTNRLIVNNGDGTFSDVSSSIQHDTAKWTTSCLICDLNGDQWPDLYSVNYLSGDIVSRICRDEHGRKNSCAPQDFPAAPDQIHLNDGTGRFNDATNRSKIRLSNGKGLGIVAADLTGNGRLDLFIANDGVPNFLLERNSKSKAFELSNVAMERGVGVNGNGLSEACMGVVVEDLDGDRLPDIFVTNFLDETNTLYRNSAAFGLFVDRTWNSGLGTASLPVLGFGVQALDGDLDGLPDLIVANGHVDNFTDRGVPYKMSPQFFHNLGMMHFAEQNAELTGKYFTGSYLGRSIARLDWDKDGAEEVAIAALDSPASLLHNETTARGSFVKISLVATATQRDAIGTVVSVSTGRDNVIQRQLTAGDGYQASNERTLAFGLGFNPQAVEVEITWPSGRVHTFSDIDPNEEYIALEGSDRLFRVPRRAVTNSTP